MYKTVRKLYQKAISRLYGTAKPTRRQSLGTVQIFRDVPVVPYQYLGDRYRGFSPHQGGPVWPNWSNQLDARHCRNGVPIDDRPVYLGQHQHQLESAAWCGAIINHFGHQIADFSTRILHTHKAYPDTKLLFSGKILDGYSSFSNTPVFFQEILNWYNIKPNKIAIINQPTLVNELLVMPQAEQLKDYAPSSPYLDLLDEHVDKKLKRQPKQAVTFVSRAGTMSRFAGEAYLESLMKEAGIRVIRPETLPLPAQLAEYASSEQLIFSEGSALHGLQLLGRCLNRIHVLNRRPGNRMARNTLSVRAKSLTHIEVSCGLVCGLWPNGQPCLPAGISILDEKAIVDYLGSISPTLRTCWNRTTYLEVRDRDVKSWLQTLAKSETAQVTSTQRSVIERLKATELSHLIPYAQTVLA